MKILRYIFLIILTPLILPTALIIYLIVEKDPTWNGYIEMLKEVFYG